MRTPIAVAFVRNGGFCRRGVVLSLSLIALFFTAPLAIHRTVESVLRIIHI